MSWQNLDRSRPDAAHYSVMKCVANEMTALREMFPEAKADDLNFVLFSTSGVHGTYMTIEAAEEEKTDVTFVIVHPRLVSMRYGNVQPETPDDWAFLKKLRQSSWDVAKQIGATAPPQQEQAAPGVVPDGLVLVPVEPNDDMLDRAVSFALNVQISGNYTWTAYMRDLWARMLSAAPKPSHVQDGWQPIETAPKDSTLVAVFWLNSDGDEMHDLDYTEDGCWVKWHDYAEHVEIIGGNGVSYTPPYTHWKHLGAPKPQEPGA